MPGPLRKLASPMLLAAAALLFALAPGCKESANDAGQNPGAGQFGAAQRELVVPAFQARSLSGKTISFPEDYRGKLVLLDFWATWCKPCIVEIPHQLEAYERFHGHGFEIVGVTLDAGLRIPPDYVRRFAKQQKMEWEQIYDGVEKLSRAYGVYGVPLGFLVDGDTGKLLAAGPTLRGDGLLKAIKRHMERRANEP